MKSSPLCSGIDFPAKTIIFLELCYHKKECDVPDVTLSDLGDKIKRRSLYGMPTGNGKKGNGKMNRTSPPYIYEEI
jgi:hypothetical protein